MENTNRRISTPAFFNDAVNFPRTFPFRSLQMEKKERIITKQPSISVIMEQSETESIENKNKNKIDNNDFKTRRESIQNQSQQSKKSNKSMKSVKSQSNVYINRAYYNSRGSNPELHTSTSTLQSSRVVREQYWTWKCCCKNWTKREKILVLVVGSLIGLILGLCSVIGVIAESRNNGTNDRPTGWSAWKL